MILDRGIFDALCWFEWLVFTSKMEEEQRVAIERFLLMDELVKCIDIVFAFCVKPTISIEREYATLLTDKPGSIMNQKVLKEYLDAIERTIATKSEFFHRIFRIDTSDKNQDVVGKEITTTTLNTLKDLLMERIGYFEIDKNMEKVLSKGTFFKHNDLKSYLPQIKFNLREQVEADIQLLQPVPVAIITNKEKTKILAIKKNKNAVSQKSPEKDRLLLYIGGHSRYEDSTKATSQDFLSICRITLKREIKEEIGISVALRNINPFYLYTPTTSRSRQHLAVCFIIPIDDDGIKLRLDPQELILNKGKSKSGKFLSLEELQQHDDLEEWSCNILEHCFNVSCKQLTMFEVIHN